MKKNRWLAGMLAFVLMMTSTGSYVFAESDEEIVTDSDIILDEGYYEEIEDAETHEISVLEYDPEVREQLLVPASDGVWDDDDLIVSDEEYFEDEAYFQGEPEGPADPENAGNPDDPDSPEISEEPVLGDGLDGEGGDGSGEDGSEGDEGESIPVPIGPGNTSFTLGENEWEMACSLTFDSNDVEPQRYKVETYNGNVNLWARYENGREVYDNTENGHHVLYLNDYPGSDHVIYVCKNTEAVISGTLTVTKMPKITSIEPAADTPLPLEGGFEQLAFDDYQVKINYADGSSEALGINDFGSDWENGYFFEDTGLTSQITDMRTFDGLAYTKVTYLDSRNEELWSFTAVFDVTPFNTASYPFINDQDTEYSFDPSQAAQKTYQIRVGETGVYEFVGHNVMISIPGVRIWGYDNRSEQGIKIRHALLEQGVDYIVMAWAERDEEDNLPASASFHWHRGAVLLSVDLSIPANGRTNWKEWWSATKILTYEDPAEQDGSGNNVIKTLRVPLAEKIPTDGKYYFDSIYQYMEPAGSDLWDFRLVSWWDFDSNGRREDEPGYIDLSSFRSLYIDNVYISDEVSVSAGPGTNEMISYALESVWEYVWDDNASAVISEDTKMNLRSAGDGEAVISAALEISPGTAEAEQLASSCIDTSFNEQIVECLDMQVVLRADSEILGNMLEIPSEVELGVAINNYDSNRYYSVLQLCNGGVERLYPSRIDENGTDAVLWFRSYKSAAFAVTVSDDSSLQPQTVWTEDIYFGSEWVQERNLVFASGGRHKLRYELKTSDPDMTIHYSHSFGEAEGTGCVRFNDDPNTEHRITITKKSEQQTSTVLTITKMPDIVSIEALNEPDLVAGMEPSALEKIMIRVSYADGSSEELLMNQFGINHSSTGQYYSDAAMTQPIDYEELANYTGPAYQQIWLCGEVNWAFTARFNIIPYQETNYPTIRPDNMTYSVGSSAEPFTEQWYKIIDIPETAVYEFVGYNVDFTVMDSNVMWGGYYLSDLSVMGVGICNTVLEAGREYLVWVRIRENRQGIIPPTGSFWVHKKALIHSISLDVNQNNTLDWSTCSDSIQKVITYIDPSDNSFHTITRPLFDGVTMDNSYCIETDIKVEPSDSVNPDPNRWKLTVIQSYGRDNEGRSAEDAGYSPVSCSETLTIYNVHVAPALSSLIRIGESAGRIVYQSLSQVIQNAAGSKARGAASASQETIESIANALEADKNISANLEINEGDGNTADIQRVQNLSGVYAEDIVKVIDARVVVRGDDDVLGTIDELAGEVELSVAVDAYDPTKTYSVYRVHGSAVEELDTDIEVNGSETELQFNTDKFSTFVVVKETKKYTVTIDADDGCTVTAFMEDSGESGDSEPVSGDGGTLVNSMDKVPAGTVLHVNSQEKTGYVFAEGGRPDASYTVDGDLTIYARTVPKTYAVNLICDQEHGSVTSDPADLSSVPYNTTVTVTAGDAAAGYEFIGWYESNGKQITTADTYTFTVLSDTTLEAKYQSVGNNVTFMANNQVQKVLSNVVSVSDSDFPAAPVPYYGYEFDGWDKTAAEINGELANGNVTVTAQFKQAITPVTVTMYNGESNTPVIDEYTGENEWISYTAIDVEGKNFAYWKLDDNILSYSKKASFRTTSDCVLRAVYASEEVAATGTAAIKTAEYNGEVHQLVFVAYLTVPEGGIIQEAGVLASSGADFDPAAQELNEDTAVYRRFSQKAVGKSGPVSYTWTKTGVSIGDLWYIRPYVSYTLNGTSEIVRGDMVSVYAGYDYNSSEKGTAIIRSAAYNPDEKTATFVAYLTIPEGGKIVKAGLVAAPGTAFDPSTQILDWSTATFKKVSTKAVGKAGPVTYTWTKTQVQQGDTWYVRPYVIYTDQNDKEHTVYGALTSFTA